MYATLGFPYEPAFMISGHEASKVRFQCCSGDC